MANVEKKTTKMTARSWLTDADFQRVYEGDESKPRKTKKVEPMHETYRRAEVIRAELRELGAGTMTVFELERGQLIEHWVLPGGRVVLLIANPDGWDLYRPFTSDNSIPFLINTLRDFAKDRNAK